MDKLPQDILISIFGDWMQFDAIIKCKQVCKKWKSIIENSDNLWEKVHSRYLYGRFRATNTNPNTDPTKTAAWVSERTSELFRESGKGDGFHSVCRYHKTRLGRLQPPLQQPFENIHGSGVRYLHLFACGSKRYVVSLGLANDLSVSLLEPVGTHWQIVVPPYATTKVTGHVFQRFSVVDASEIVGTDGPSFYAIVCTGGRANEPFRATSFSLPSLDLWDVTGGQLRNLVQGASLQGFPLTAATIIDSSITGQCGMLFYGRDMAKYYVPDRYNPRRASWGSSWDIATFASEPSDDPQHSAAPSSAHDVVDHFILPDVAVVVLVQKCGLLAFVDIPSGKVLCTKSVLQHVSAVSALVRQNAVSASFAIGSEEGEVAMYCVQYTVDCPYIELTQLAELKVSSKAISFIFYDSSAEMLLVASWDTLWRWFDIVQKSVAEFEGHVFLSAVCLVCVDELHVSEQVALAGRRNMRNGHFASTPSSLFHSSAITSAFCHLDRAAGTCNFLTGHYNGTITSWTWPPDPNVLLNINGRSPIIPTQKTSKAVSPIFFPQTLFNDSTDSFW